MNVTIIGGANVDIGGIPLKCLVEGDSAPGKSITSFGGVARNIAENAVALGLSVNFVSVFGNDVNGRHLWADCEKLGFDMSLSRIIRDERTSTYLFLTDEKGEMKYSVSDMEIVKCLDIAYFRRIIDVINRSDVCVIDTNLTVESIEYLMNNVTCPIFMDPVSTRKSEKLIGMKLKLHTFKPNVIEAETISGVKITTIENCVKAAESIRSMGVENVYISMREHGVFYSNGIVSGVSPSRAERIVNTSGAGDSVLAALIWAYGERKDIAESAAAAMAAAALTVGSEGTVAQRMSASVLRAALKG